MHTSGAARQLLFGPPFITPGECLASATAPDFVRLGLDVPFGASLSQVVVTVNSGVGASYSLDVLVKTAGATSYTSTPILTAGGTGTGVLARHTMTRVTPVVVGAAQHVELRLSAGQSAGLCAVEVVCTLPGTP